MHDPITKAVTLLEALPCIQKLSHATFILKYGGSFMDLRMLDTVEPSQEFQNA